MVQKIILASPRGYCAGVRRAIDIVERALEIYGKPLYVKHQIVHNEHVVRALEKKGAIFVEGIADIPQGSRVIFSAHGTSPKVKGEAEQRNLKVIDAVCPLVTKVHVEARRYHRNGYTIILIGHKGHIEVEGTMGHAPMEFVETVEDVKTLSINSDKIAFLTQTTLSLADTKEVVDALKKKYPGIESPPKGDICYATTNRQAAVKEMAKKADFILVVGSEESSNSKRLVDTAHCCGVSSVLVPDCDALKKEWFDKISVLGITSGASVPDSLVDKVISRIQEWYPAIIERFELIKENVEFLMPDELKR